MAETSTAIEELKTLNEQIAEMEQQRNDKAIDFFRRHLSDRLIFRRADGSVVGKGGTPEQKGFIEGLDGKSPFTSREAEDIKVTLLDDRALVTLIVRTRKADGTKNRYRNIRMFSKQGDNWILELWYNYEIV